MKEKKRTKKILIRVSPEFLELADLLKRNTSYSDLIHAAIAKYAYTTYTPPTEKYSLEQINELAQSVGNVENQKERKKGKEWWAAPLAKKRFFSTANQNK